MQGKHSQAGSGRGSGHEAGQGSRLEEGLWENWWECGKKRCSGDGHKQKGASRCQDAEGPSAEVDLRERNRLCPRSWVHGARTDRAPAAGTSMTERSTDQNARSPGCDACCPVFKAPKLRGAAAGCFPAALEPPPSREQQPRATSEGTCWASKASAREFP